MSSESPPFSDESWRIRDIQFDDPQVWIRSAAPFDIGSARLRIRWVLGPHRLPHIAARCGKALLKQRPEGAAVAALDKNISRPLIARRKHGRESSRGFGPADKQIDEEAALQPRHGQSGGAASGRVTRFRIGEQRIECFVAFRAAQPLCDSLIAKHSGHARECLQMIGPGIERRQDDEEQVDRKAIDGLKVDGSRKLQKQPAHPREVAELCMGQRNAAPEPGRAEPLPFEQRLRDFAGSVVAGPAIRALGINGRGP